MKKKLCIGLFLSLFVYTREAYAIFDIMAKVQSALELYKDVENKVQQYTKKLRDIEKRARQGFDLASSCYKNPKQCDPKALEAFAKVLDVEVSQLFSEAETLHHLSPALEMIVRLLENENEKVQKTALKQIEVLLSIKNNN